MRGRGGGLTSEGPTVNRKKKKIMRKLCIHDIQKILIKQVTKNILNEKIIRILIKQVTRNILNEKVGDI